MTNEKFVNKHLDRNFHLGVGEYGFAYIDKFTGNKMSYHDFTIHLNTILGVEYILEYNKWIDVKRKEFLKTLFTYLETCHVALGIREWGLYDSNDKPVSITNVIKEININDESDFTKGFEKLYEDWFLNKIIEHTEKTMSQS